MAETPSKRRRTQTERRDEAAQRIISAAIEVVAEKGLRGLLLSEVGSRAGYSPALTVHYFKTKEALILEVANRIIGDYAAGLRARANGASGLKALRQFVHVYLAYALEFRTARRALFMITSEAAVDAPLRESIAALSRRGAESVARLIREGQDAGEIDPMIDADAHALMVFAALRGAVSLWAVDETIDLPRIATALEGSLVHSLRTREAVVAAKKTRSR